MELLRVVKRRSLLSETIYVLLNLALAIAVVSVTIATGTPWLALTLVVLSKWRIFAVRPRFWYAHVESNLVDIIVSIGLVILIYLAGQAVNHSVMTQVLLGILYGGWLLFLKPRAKRSFVALQAAAATLVGTMALFSLSYEWPSSVVVIAIWLIGYASARHVFMAYSDSDARALSLIWGFVAAEIGWLSYHWTIAYSLPFVSGLHLPQASLLLLGIGFLAERVYAAYHKNETVKLNDVALPLLLVLGVMFILLTLFNAAAIGTA